LLPNFSMILRNRRQIVRNLEQFHAQGSPLGQLKVRSCSPRTLDEAERKFTFLIFLEIELNREFRLTRRFPSAWFVLHAIGNSPLEIGDFFATFTKSEHLSQS
jgi:hypothetical protein